VATKGLYTLTVTDNTVDLSQLRRPGQRGTRTRAPAGRISTRTPGRSPCTHSTSSRGPQDAAVTSSPRLLTDVGPRTPRVTDHHHRGPPSGSPAGALAVLRRPRSPTTTIRPPHAGPAPSTPVRVLSRPRGQDAGALAACANARPRSSPSRAGREAAGGEGRRRPARAPESRGSSGRGRRPPTGAPASTTSSRARSRTSTPRFQTMRATTCGARAAGTATACPSRSPSSSSLGLHNKLDIEAYGIAEFNAKCRASVFTFLEDWNRLTERIGFWVDLDERLSHSRLRLHRVGLVGAADDRRQGPALRGPQGRPLLPRAAALRSPATSWRSATATSVVDPSVYVRFPVARPTAEPLQAGDELQGVWTTTPWTLVSNAAVAVDPELTYVRAKTGALEAPVRPLPRRRRARPARRRRPHPRPLPRRPRSTASATRRRSTTSRARSTGSAGHRVLARRLRQPPRRPPGSSTPPSPSARTISAWAPSTG